MRIYLIIVAAFIILSSCEKNHDRSLYNQAWNEKSIPKALLYLNSVTDDQEKANTYFLIGYLHKKNNQFDSALLYLGQAIPHFIKAADEKYVAETYRLIGNIHKESYNPSLALRFYTSAREFTKNELLVQKLNLYSAHCHWVMGELESAAKLLDRSNAYFEGSSNYHYAEGLLIYGNLHFDHAKEKGDRSLYDKSFASFYKAMELYESDQDKAMAMNNIGNTYIEMGEYAKAQEFLSKALMHHTREKDKVNTYHNLGKLFLAKGKTDSSMFYFKKSIDISNTVSFEFNESSIYITGQLLARGEDLKVKSFLKYYVEKNQVLIENRNALETDTQQLLWQNHLLKSEVEQMQENLQKERIILGLRVGIPAMLIVALLFIWLSRYRKRIEKVKLMLNEP